MTGRTLKSTLSYQHALKPGMQMSGHLRRVSWSSSLVVEAPHLGRRLVEADAVGGTWHLVLVITLVPRAFLFADRDRLQFPSQVLLFPVSGADQSNR